MSPIRPICLIIGASAGNRIFTLLPRSLTLAAMALRWKAAHRHK
jgi:hypothetical protein